MKLIILILITVGYEELKDLVDQEALQYLERVTKPLEK